MLNSRQAVMLQITMQILAVDGPQAAMDFSEELTDMVMGAKPVTSGETSVRPTPVAQKITTDDLHSLISRTEYTRLAGTTKTFCHIFIGDSGFLVTGESACLNPADFDEAVGRDYAFKDAFNKLWPLEGYHRMRTAQHRTERSIGAAESMAIKKEACRMMTGRAGSIGTADTVVSKLPKLDAAIADFGNDYHVSMDIVGVSEFRDSHR